MLYEAAHVAEDSRLSQDSLRDDAYLAKYAKEWGKPDDLGIVAYVSDRGEAVGAAWVRQLAMVDGDRGFKVPLPELAIGVIPGYRGQGIGTELLRPLLDAARQQFPGITLTVRESNPARRLYERMGFRAVPGQVINRVGGRSVRMCVVWTDACS